MVDVLTTLALAIVTTLDMLTPTSLVKVSKAILLASMSRG